MASLRAAVAAPLAAFAVANQNRRRTARCIADPVGIGTGRLRQVVQTSRAETWAQLDDLLFSKHVGQGSASTPWVFRGAQTYYQNPCRSSLEGFAPTAATRFDIECGLLRSFKKYAVSDLAHSSSWWELLALAEHHSLPTRMVNFSHSPYVALHFATVSDFDSDGEIWCVNAGACHAVAGDTLRLGAHRGSDKVVTIEQLEDLLSLSRSEDTKDPAIALGHLDVLEGPIFVEPPASHTRAISQHHVYAMTSARITLEDWLVQRPDLVHVIVIPKGMKREARQRLDMIGVNERAVMGGLDGLCSWLKRHYQSGPLWAHAP